jgi:hypothetical protein
MKSIAAYYVVVATTNAQHEAERRRATVQAPRPARPSLLARVRMLVAPARSAEPATSAA